jgi:lipopolysaccharide export system protein LptC
MSTLKSVYRFRLWTVLALAVTLALGSFWASQVMQKKLEDALPDAPRSAPDYYVEKFNLVKMSVTGEARYTISGARLTHQPMDDSHMIELPVIHSLGSDRAPMTMRADRARVEENNSKVHMLGNVTADRPASPKSQSFHLDTQYLLVLPDDDVMRSDQLVHVRMGQSTMAGVGMIANNATRQLEILRRANVSFAPSGQR